MPALIEKVPGFKKHIRVFIVHTLATTFQDSTRENMEQCLDLVSAGRGQAAYITVIHVFNQFMVASYTHI